MKGGAERDAGPSDAPLVLYSRHTPRLTPPHAPLPDAATAADSASWLLAINATLE